MATGKIHCVLIIIWSEQLYTTLLVALRTNLTKTKHHHQIRMKLEKESSSSQDSPTQFTRVSIRITRKHPTLSSLNVVLNWFTLIEWKTTQAFENNLYGCFVYMDDLHCKFWKVLKYLLHFTIPKQTISTMWYHHTSIGCYLLSCLLAYATALSIDLRFVLEPAKSSCFYQYFSADLKIVTQFIVVSPHASQVTFKLRSPDKRTVATEISKSRGQVEFETKSYKAGDYEFCFDNNLSSQSRKTIQFYVTTNDSFQDPVIETLNTRVKHELRKDNLGDHETRIDSLKQQINKIEQILEDSQHHISIYNAHETTDRDISEENFERVNFWSTLFTLSMILVAGIQVVLVRSLFEFNSRIGRLIRWWQQRVFFFLFDWNKY